MTTRHLSCETSGSRKPKFARFSAQAAKRRTRTDATACRCSDVPNEFQKASKSRAVKRALSLFSPVWMDREECSVPDTSGGLVQNDKNEKPAGYALNHP